ncbi:MAG: hypothetical protein AB4352_08035 [Hormoscilla sp.]
MDGFQRRSVLAEDRSKASWKRLGSPPNPQEDPIMQALNLLQERLEKQATAHPSSQHSYLLPDWSTLIEPTCHLTARKLKELVLAIEQKRPQPRMTLIVIGSDWSIPAILRNHVHILDLPLPIGEELYQDVFSVAVRKYELGDKEARGLSEEAQGMPLQAAKQTARLITAKSLWDQPEEAGQLLLKVKTKEIRKTGVLEYYPPPRRRTRGCGGFRRNKTLDLKSSDMV